MSKKNKAPKSEETKLQGLEALSALLEPEPEQDAIDTAIAALENDPAFVVVDQAAALLTESAALTVKAQEMETESLKRESRLGDIAIQQTGLQKTILNFKEKIRKGMLNSSSINTARALWQDQFASKLDAAVEEGAKRSTKLQEMQTELSTLVAEAERIRTANKSDIARAAIYRASSDKCAKEAGDLLASVQA